MNRRALYVVESTIDTRLIRLVSSSFVGSFVMIINNLHARIYNVLIMNGF